MGDTSSISPTFEFCVNLKEAVKAQCSEPKEQFLARSTWVGQVDSPAEVSLRKGSCLENLCRENFLCVSCVTFRFSRVRLADRVAGSRNG